MNERDAAAMKSFKPVKPEIEKAVEGETSTELAANVDLGLLARMRDRFETAMRRVRSVLGSVEDDVRRKRDE